MKEKLRTLRNIRMPEHLDNQVLEFAKKYFDGDYSKAYRWLVQAGLIVAERVKE